MRVRIERTGGFAGVTEPVAEYDTDDLPQDEASAVRDAVAALAAATARGETGEIGADLMTYKITVGEDSERIYAISGEPPQGLAGPLTVLLRRSPDS